LDCDQKGEKALVTNTSVSAQGVWCPLCAVNKVRWIVTRKAKKR